MRGGGPGGGERGGAVAGTGREAFGAGREDSAAGVGGGVGRHPVDVQDGAGVGDGLVDLVERQVRSVIAVPPRAPDRRRARLRRAKAMLAAVRDAPNGMPRMR